MANILDSIQLSGSSYDLKDKNAPSVSAVTQQEYDNLPSSAKTSNTFFVITDAQAGDLTNYYTKSETNTLLDGKQDTLVSSQNIKTINNESILGEGNIDIQGGGGGKAIEAGRGISITTGETADTVSFNLPISAGTGTNSVIEGSTYNSARGNYAHAEGYDTNARGQYSHAEGYNTEASGEGSHAEGTSTSTKYYSHGEGNATFAVGNYSHAEGDGTTAATESSHAEGRYTVTKNNAEHASGQYNNSVSATTTFGDSGNTLFSVGNGTSTSARHNAFEIRQNGDIYLSSGGTDIKLQDHLGGGGVNVVQTTGTSTTDVMSQNAVTTQLGGYVTTDTEQTISGRKIFTYSGGSSKAIEFKQTSPSNKVGFRVTNSASTNNEVASFEFRPDTYTDSSSVKHPLLYFGHYRNTATANAGVPQTMVGFRQYDQSGAAAYHYLMPLPAEAKTPFSLTTSFKNYFAPLGFKNGSTMITTDNTGVVDLSSELGGLKLVKLTQAEYDALATKDNSTLYVIVN